MAASRFPALASAGFRQLLATRFLSSLAINAQAVILGWHLYDVTGSALYVALIGLAQFLPGMLLVMVTGLASDLLPRRSIIATCLTLMSVCSLASAGIVLLGVASPWPYLGLICATATARAFLNPAQQSLLPALVPQELLTNAVAMNSVFTRTSQAMGPFLGGLIYSLAPVVSLGLVSATFLLAAFAATRIPRQTETVPTKRISPDDLVAGFRFVWATKPVLGAVTLDLLVIVLGGVTGLLPVVVHDVLGGDATTLGLLRACFAGGGLSSALFFSVNPVRRRAGVMMMSAVVLFGLSAVVVGLSPFVWLSGLTMAVMGASDMTSVLIRWTLIQLWTPDEVRGRVAAITGVAALGSNDLGDFRGGLASAAFGVAPAMVVGGISTVLVAALWSRLFPQLRKVDSI